MSKALIHSNVHLKDPKKRLLSLEKNVSTSSAVEGVFVVREGQSDRFVHKDSSPESKTVKSET